MHAPSATTPVTKLDSRDFPALFVAADKTSLHYQRLYNWEVRLELSLLIVGALAGLVTIRASLGGTNIDWAGAVAALAFFAGFLFQTIRLIQQPNRFWYGGRAVAESVKTVTWRYAVGGSPFMRAEGDAPETDAARRVADQLLQKKLIDILRMQAKETPLALEMASEEITPAMRALRQRPLSERREVYKNGRIHDQQQWYARKAQFNQRRVGTWSSLLLILELGGATVAIAKMVGAIQLDLLGVFGTMIAAAATWLQLKQHQNLAQSYSVASLELLTILSTLEDQQTEEQWSTYVDSAEEAISREHTLWVSRQSLNASDA